jgi:hypothetical protein
MLIPRIADNEPRPQGAVSPDFFRRLVKEAEYIQSARRRGNNRPMYTVRLLCLTKNVAYFFIFIASPLPWEFVRGRLFRAFQRPIALIALWRDRMEHCG